MKKKNKVSLTKSLAILFAVMIGPIALCAFSIKLDIDAAKKRQYDKEMDRLVDHALEDQYRPIIVLRDDALQMFPQEDPTSHMKHTRRFIEVEEDGEGNIMSYKDIRSPRSIIKE
jgi:hypothetical protein